MIQKNFGNAAYHGTQILFPSIKVKTPPIYVGWYVVFVLLLTSKASKFSNITERRKGRTEQPSKNLFMW